MMIASSITIGSILVFIGLNYIVHEIRRLANEVDELRGEIKRIGNRH